MQATTNKLVQPNQNRKPPPLSLASLVRAFQLNWMRHHKPVMHRDDFSRYTGGNIKLPWWFFVRDCLFWWYVDDEYS